MADTTPTTPVTVTVITASRPTSPSSSSAAAARRAERRRLGVPELDTRPRPLRQSLWILASAALVLLALLSASDRIGQTGASISSDIQATELLELADPHPAPTPTTVPAAPTQESSDAMDHERTTTIPLPDPATDDVPDQVPDHVIVGREALTGISYPWERLLPDWTVEFLPAEEGLYGLTLVPERRIEIYVRPDQSPAMVAHVIAHELGHAVDVTLNDGDDRDRWASSRGLDDAPWWPESGATDFSTGAGDFAESFAAWQVGPSGFRSTLAPAPDGAQIELLAELSAS